MLEMRNGILVEEDSDRVLAEGGGIITASLSHPGLLATQHPHSTSFLTIQQLLSTFICGQLGRARSSLTLVCCPPDKTSASVNLHLWSPQQCNSLTHLSVLPTWQNFSLCQLRFVVSSAVQQPHSTSICWLPDKTSASVNFHLWSSAVQQPNSTSICCLPYNTTTSVNLILLRTVMICQELVSISYHDLNETCISHMQMQSNRWSLRIIFLQTWMDLIYLYSLCSY